MRGEVTSHVLLGRKRHGGLFTQRNKVGAVCVASKFGGQKDGNEYCSPEISSPSEAAEGISHSADLFLEWGRP
ncbi:hypothetical protein ACFQ4A_17040 [Lentibacillus salinarum]|uniref:Uncharacterized protein n=1 Tax=Lentibacillus salinarum TaxID=446820 RepID=A0ABW3ZYN6_9BACI